MKQNSLLENESAETTSGPVECLRLTFKNDEARRAHFTKLLAEKLKDPEFRKIEGFPIGTDEAILELSDPPFYTACPNPWLNDFISLWESQKERADEDYHREPFAADVSEGKNDPIYNAHSYHTKVPHKAIMRYILHYTNPGDIVFDGFCGTGMTGVAAACCSNTEVLESMGFKIDGNNILEINESGVKEFVAEKGPRKAVLSDLSPAATFIASGYNLPKKPQGFPKHASDILQNAKAEMGYLYKTSVSPEQDIAHLIKSLEEGNYSNIESCQNLGDVNYILFSDVFSCTNCEEEIVLWDNVVDEANKQVLDSFPCPNCSHEQTKKEMDRVWITTFDPLVRQPLKIAKQVPALINYTYKKKRYFKKADAFDIALIKHSDSIISGDFIPIVDLIDGINTKQPKDSHGVVYLHQFWTTRTLLILSKIRKSNIGSLYIKKAAEFWLNAANRNLSRLAKLGTGNFLNGGGGAINAGVLGTLYLPSFSVELNPLKTLNDRFSKSVKFWESKPYQENVINTSSTTSINQIKDESVDYAFIDPPFGANINYSDLNFLWEGWFRLLTNQKDEAIQNSHQNKGIDDYRILMVKSFKEVYRILKPGRWMTVEFSNTKASVWNSIQLSLQEAGFIVANVSALDKKLMSFKAVTTTTAVKQDLIISAYKPDTFLEKLFTAQSDNTDNIWEFVKSHLNHLPVIKVINKELQFIPERDPRLIFDQVVSYFFRNGFTIPMSTQEFQNKLLEKFPYRDGMIFLAEQLIEYDKARISKGAIKQLTIFVDDEASAIEWLRQELKSKPKNYAEIHPLFLNELSGWKKNELQLELSTLLEQNFIKYDGKEDVPNQIHTYLSTNFKDMRGLAKDDPALVAKAKDRWYVPDLNKAGDLEKVRLRALLREFEVYKAEKKKIKQPRAEALRAGFNHCWENQDLQTILDISAKIPPAVLQEDEKLLMFYDNAVTLTSNTDDDWD